MKTGILLFEQFHGKKDIGSSRIRGHWIVKFWEQAGIDLGTAELFKFGQKYDAIIFQKVYWPAYAKAFQGIKILDLCDADWLDWNCKLTEMLEEVDAITCSSLELTKAVGKFTKKPVYFIPDRVDTSSFPAPKEHSGPAKRVAWFGYSQNFPVLDAAVPALHKRGLSLVVVADKVYVPPAGVKLDLVNYPFNPTQYLLDIQSADIVLNPQFKKGKWRFKSDNKTSIAKALGMPVAHTDKELDQLLSEEARKEASKKGLLDVAENYDIKLSVVDYKDVIQDILNSKNGK